MPLAARSSGQGPRVVLVHGFTQTGASWARVAADLSRGYEVVCVDAPGHGGSGDARADLVEGAFLLGDTGGRATYVGYSMGGRLALHLAFARPEVVERLVLLGATAGIDDESERAARRADDDALAASVEADGVEAFVARWLAQPMFAGVPDDPAERAARLTNTTAGLASSLRLAGTGAQSPLWSRLDAIAMPVLVLAGERDDKFAALGRRMVDTIGPNAMFALVPGAGHAAHLERPDAFLTVLRAWLPRPFDQFVGSDPTN